MSALSTSDTAAVESSLLLTPSSTGDDVVALANYLYERQDSYKWLSTWSRNGWFESVLGDVCTHLSLHSLRFLARTGNDFCIRSEKYGDFSVTVLDTKKIEQAIREANMFLAYAEHSPDKLAQEIEYLTFDGWSAEAIRREVLESVALPRPSQIDHDGDTPRYLASCVKMLIEVLNAAIERNLSVIYVGSMAG